MNRISDAALHNIYGRLRFWNEISASIEQPSEQILDAEQREIDRLREWVKGVAGWRVRRAYRGWLDCAQRGLNAARQEMKYRRLSNSYDRWQKRFDTERRETIEMAKTLPRP